MHEGVPILEVSNLSSAYISRPWGFFGKKEKKSVLNNINFNINEGEIFGLVGESGSGKSTLAKCILGLIDYEGDIYINSNLRKKGKIGTGILLQHTVQAVFQDPGASLNPVKTVGWILEEPLRAHKISKKPERDQKIDKMLELVGLNSSYKNRKPDELSSGQKQRVSIGAALMLQPSLLIADEPVSALDVSVGAAVINLFKELKNTLNLAILFISHNHELVYYLSDRIAILEAGCINEMQC